MTASSPGRSYICLDLTMPRSCHSRACATRRRPRSSSSGCCARHTTSSAPRNRRSCCAPPPTTPCVSNCQPDEPGQAGQAGRYTAAAHALAVPAQAQNVLSQQRSARPMTLSFETRRRTATPSGGRCDVWPPARRAVVGARGAAARAHHGRTQGGPPRAAARARISTPVPSGCFATRPLPGSSGRAAAEAEPTVEFTWRDEQHRLWQVDDPARPLRNRHGQFSVARRAALHRRRPPPLRDEPGLRAMKPARSVPGAERDAGRGDLGRRPRACSRCPPTACCTASTRR